MIPKSSKHSCNITKCICFVFIQRITMCPHTAITIVALWRLLHLGHRMYLFVYLFFNHSFILHRLDNRTRLKLTPYDGQRWWDSNLRRPACEAPALTLCILGLQSDSGRRTMYTQSSTRPEFEPMRDHIQNISCP